MTLCVLKVVTFYDKLRELSPDSAVVLGSIERFSVFQLMVLV